MSRRGRPADHLFRMDVPRSRNIPCGDVLYEVQGTTVLRHNDLGAAQWFDEYMRRVVQDVSACTCEGIVRPGDPYACYFNKPPCGCGGIYSSEIFHCLVRTLTTVIELEIFSVSSFLLTENVRCKRAEYLNCSAEILTHRWSFSRLRRIYAAQICR